MDSDNKRSFWEKTGDFFLGPKVAPETFSEQQGSVDSAGGTSPLPGVVPPTRSTAPVIGAREALTIIPVRRAVDLIKNGVSQLPLAVQKDGKDIRVPAFVSKPDVFRTQTEFLSLTAGHLATYGNAFWRIHRTDNGGVNTIQVLNPELVTYGFEQNRLVYRYNAQTIDSNDIQHLMVFPHFEPGSTVVSGLGPIQAGHRELQAILEMNEYVSDYFRNGAIPRGFIAVQQPLGQGQGAEIADAFDAKLRTGRTPVFGSGISYSPVSSDPEQARYHESAQKSVVDVARMFGIPDRFLLAAVDGSSMTYSNDTSNDKQFVKYTLSAYLVAIEDAFSALLPRGQRAKFNVDAFLRMFTEDRYAQHKVAIDAGFLTVNEVRALEDLGPIATPNPTEGDTSAN
jgi:HK97 family phage portal protein